MWEFDGPRNAAVHYLDSLESPIDPIDKVCLSMQYEVKDWLLPALLKLAQRPESISIEEGRKIGFENTVKLASVREKVRWNEGSSNYCYSCHRSYNNRILVTDIREPETAQLDFTSLIRSTFDL